MGSWLGNAWTLSHVGAKQTIGQIPRSSRRADAEGGGTEIGPPDPSRGSFKENVTASGSGIETCGWRSSQACALLCRRHLPCPNKESLGDRGRVALGLESRTRSRGLWTFRDLCPQGTTCMPVPDPSVISVMTLDKSLKISKLQCHELGNRVTGPAPCIPRAAGGRYSA